MQNIISSFTFRFWLISTSLALLVSIPISIYYSDSNYKLLEAHSKSELRSMGKAASLSIELAIKTNDFEIIKKSIDRLYADKEFAFIAIMERQASQELKVFKCFPDSLTDLQPFYDTINYHLISTPVHSEIISGEIVLGKSKDRDQKVIDKLNKPIIELTILINVLLLVLFSVFLIFVTLPIRKASEFAQKLSEFNYSAQLSPSNGNNEISKLKNALITLKNNLVDLKDKNAALMRGLETEIKRQTEEINFKSKLQHLLISIASDYSYTDFVSTDVSAKIKNSLSLVAEFISSKSAMVIGMNGDVISLSSGWCHTSMDNFNKDDFIISIDQKKKLASYESKEIKKIHINLENKKQHNELSEVIFYFHNCPGNFVVFKILKQDGSVGGFLVFEENDVTAEKLNSIEIDELINVFIGMMTSLDSRFIQDSNAKVFSDNLEKKVAERTSELKENEVKLKQSLEKEIELSQLKSSFVSTASHQFRTPLSAIQSNSDLLDMLVKGMDDDLQERFSKVTSRIKLEVVKMTNLMNDVLILGKSASETNPYHPERLDLIPFCNQIVDEYNEAQTDGRSLEFEVLGDSYDSFLDPQLLNHSLTNLVDNAFKYSKGRKNPELTLSFNAAEISFRIKDYGIGIPEYDLGKMFQPFFRAENVTAIEGTGLGLSIAKEFVNKNKGEITISSIEGEGCDIEMIYKQV